MFSIFFRTNEIVHLSKITKEINCYQCKPASKLLGYTTKKAKQLVRSTEKKKIKISLNKFLIDQWNDKFFAGGKKKVTTRKFW